MRIRVLIVAVCLFFPGFPLRASPIIYTFNGTAIGSAGTRNFADALFTIDVFADTADVQQSQRIFSVNDVRSTIEIEEIGVGTFTTDKLVFCNQQLSTLGLNIRLGESGRDLLDMAEPPFANYELRTSFGPIFEPTPHAVSLFVNQPSTLGNITLSSARDVTFVARVVPEPHSLPLVLIVAAALTASRCAGKSPRPWCGRRSGRRVSGAR
jgi:hypothetical protein